MPSVGETLALSGGEESEASMSSLFGRQFWIIRLLGVATASALAGSAASSALALLILDRASSAFETTDTGDDSEEELDDEPKVLAKTTPKPTARGTFARQAANATLDAYNPFCPTCEPVTASPVLLAQGGGAAPTTAAVATRLPLRLHVTMEAERAHDSLATIYDVERNVVGVYGVGDALREGVTVFAVSHGKVELRTPTGAEMLELGKPLPEPKAEAKAEKPDAKEKEPKAKPMAESPDLDAIQCASADVCTVERAFVDEILSNPAKFASQAPRIAPLPDGGFKLAGVRKGSLAAKLGLASGDILLAVNGTELKGIDDALGLMTKLRRASNLEVTLDRKGKAVRKQIEIR